MRGYSFPERGVSDEPQSDDATPSLVSLLGPVPLNSDAELLDAQATLLAALEHLVAQYVRFTVDTLAGGGAER